MYLAIELQQRNLVVRCIYILEARRLAHDRLRQPRAFYTYENHPAAPRSAMRKKGYCLDAHYNHCDTLKMQGTYNLQACKYNRHQEVLLYLRYQKRRT